MMLLDNINTQGSFDINMRSGGPKVSVKAYATSGMVANTPYMVQFAGSGYNASILAASNYAYVGVHEGGKALASGCTGWVQIRGPVDDVQFGTADASGSQGHAVFWGAAAVGASSSAFEGLHKVGQIGVLLESVDESTTANLYLTGAWATPRS